MTHLFRTRRCHFPFPVSQKSQLGNASTEQLWTPKHFTPSVHRARAIIAICIAPALLLFSFYFFYLFVFSPPSRIMHCTA